jgi:hypothetical protein
VDWWGRAACKDMPTQWFFSENPTLRRRAKDACDVCPVRAECLTYVMKLEEPEPGESKTMNLTRRFGLFGGLYPKQRLALAYPSTVLREAS